jgi:lipopolysaccharide transport system permease protein
MKYQEATATAPSPDQVLGTVSETVIRPVAGWELVRFAELWRFRDLIMMLVWRDISVRYKQTALGIAWALLQPTAMMAVFAGVFGRLAHLPSGELPYPLFVFAGLIPWIFFSTAITNAAHSIVENERLVTKVYFPRLAIPLAAIGAALVDFFLALGLLVALMLVYGVSPGWNLLALPIAILMLVMAATGIGALLSALNVAYRDFRYVVGFLVQLWMFATPTIYMDYQPLAPQAATNHAATAIANTSSVAKPSLTVWDVARQLVNMNPMTSLIASFRAATTGGGFPWMQLGLSAIGTSAFLIGGLLYFRRVEDSFADII